MILKYPFSDHAMKRLNVLRWQSTFIATGEVILHPPQFKNVENMLASKDPLPEPTHEDKKRALLRHLELELRYRDERVVVLIMRRIASWYFKGSPGSGEFRAQINSATSIDQIRELIDQVPFFDICHRIL